MIETDEGILWLLIGDFAARDDLYVQNGAGVVRQPLTPAVIIDAQEHHYAVSGYTARADGLTHIGAVDVDKDADEGMALGLKVARVLHDHHLPALVVESRRGCHVWLTLGWHVEAGTMWRCLRQAIGLAGGDLHDPSIEVFPHRADGLGAGALRIPGLPHHKTGIVYPAHDWDGTPIPAGIQNLLRAHHVGSPPDVVKLAGLSATTPYPNRLDRFYGFKPPKDWGEDPSASAILTALGVPNARPGATVKCPMHEDRRGSLTIFRDDHRVYCGAPSCRLHNGGHGVGSVLLGRM